MEGFEILEAADGIEGAEAIEQREDLNLVICDVNMPRMNGLEMLERVKDRLFPHGVKVVMLTTEGQPKLIKRARELGAVGWIVKPFNPIHLLAAARKLTA